MEQMVYVRLRHRVHIRVNQTKIVLDDIAKLVGAKEVVSKLRSLPIYEVTKSDPNIIVIDLSIVVEKISERYQKIDIQVIGPSQTIIEIVPNQRGNHTFLFLLVWLLLFIGSALTIMNFHEDVSMPAVHQKLYKLITGSDAQKPLILQIPYSFGLGLGMVLFFNHFFKKRFNEEPSPLEVEMFNYQQDLDQYVLMTENQESIRDIDDHT
ncbi:stage V sporulation protein AA [Bacillus sp. AGMB 02131]|uniref:Stage V sporulation protein AA n=1 Tax=Peribacillus faecalis TaxID=2772559 RepID=A0A927HCM5_9BACI|nr:stage V sporulation protein AA [Peribacillus faecalis]MBD3109716.1 stage V sporulation protein AA [Peribacillus faecalis]